MKKRFLSLVENVKQTGIVEALLLSSNPKEFRKIWKDFSEENMILFGMVNDWAYDVKSSNSYPIFKKAEKLENPMEIVVTIHMIDEVFLDEHEIFQDWYDLTEELERMGTNSGKALARHIRERDIIHMSAERIFSHLNALKALQTIE